MWDATFILPKSIPAGSYRLTYHNGSGGSQGWTPIGAIAIAGSHIQPDRMFNVQEYGARGDGVTMDLPAISSSMKAAAAIGGGIVYFPRGRYLVSDTITIPPNVELRGEGRDLVNILWQESETPPQYLIYGSSHFALTELTLYASNHFHGIGNDLVSTSEEGSGNVRIERIRVRLNMYRGHLQPDQIDGRFRESLNASTGGFDTIRLGGENIKIVDCDIYGSGRSLFLFKPTHAYVARNKFYNGRWGWYSISGADGVIFENNEIIGGDLMSTGGGINNLGDQPLSRNVFFFRNHFELLHGWDREAVTSDAGGGYYYGKVTVESPHALSLQDVVSANPAARGGWKGAGVFIMGGKGMGQFAQIVKLEDKMVHLDRSWMVPPDDSSIVSITMMQQNYLFIDNEFIDAGIGVQFYGTSIGHIISGNKSTRTGGFTASGRWYQHFQPSWYCQFLDNEIIEGNIYRSGANNATLSGEAVIGAYGYQREPNTAPLTIGTVIRRNRLRSNAHIEVFGIDKRSPGIRDVIVEYNTVENADAGILIDEGSVGVLVRGNVLRNVKDVQ